MKRKAEIEVMATYVATVDLTDAKWKKLIGDYFEPNGNTWGTDHPWAIESWAEEEITLGMCQCVLNRVPESNPMPHLAENPDGAQEVLIEFIEAEYEAIELTDSLGV